MPVVGGSSTRGASSAHATTAPIEVRTTNWASVAGTRSFGPASGEAEIR